MNRLQRMSGWMVAPLVLGASITSGTIAQTKAHPKTAVTIPVVMLSDIHFDPFHDPAKIAQLRETPVAGWPVVLNAPDSATREADLARLQAACPTHGIDTPWTLLKSSLHAAHAQQPRPSFVTVSGDLMAHGFQCRFELMAPGAGAEAYSAFAAKTIAFDAFELRSTFPGVPIYFALGNNDSGCGDYQESENSKFLQSTAHAFADDVLDPRNRKAVLAEFPAEGDYSVVLPKPMLHTRLIVLQNIFASNGYKACDGKPDASDAAATTQANWLRDQLSDAHTHHEQVWVMAHIPPGVNAYATLLQGRNVCAGQEPVMFLNSGKIADALKEHVADVKLAIFAHTHMDEMRLLEPTIGAGAGIPVKLVSSTTPISGNLPTFTVARVNPRTATMVDYTVYIADNKTGVDTKWSKEYRYSDSFGLPDFSAKSLALLFTGFRDDKIAANAKTDAYVSHVYPGGNMKRSTALHLAWPTYACSLTEDTTEGFRSCLCPATPRATETPQDAEKP